MKKALQMAGLKIAPFFNIENKMHALFQSSKDLSSFL